MLQARNIEDDALKALEPFKCTTQSHFLSESRFPGSRFGFGALNADMRTALTRDIQDLKSLREKALDDVRSHFEHMLKAVQSRRESLAPIHGLPRLILDMIFQDAGEQGLDYRTCSTVTHVCGYWRNAALRSHRMWFRLDLKSIPIALAKEFIARSKKAPLIFSIANWDPAHRQLCRSHISRIRELVIDNCRYYYRLDPEWLRDISALNLHAFTIKYDGGQGRHLSEFIRKAPTLCELRMHGILRLPRVSGSYKNLKILEIVCSEDYSDDENNFLVVFRQSPLLEVFHCSCTATRLFQITSKVSEAKSKLIPMRKLRTLHLALYYVEIAFILRHIATPLDMKLTLTGIISRETRRPPTAEFLPRDPRCLPCLSKTSRFKVDEEGIRAFADPMTECFAAISITDNYTGDSDAIRNRVEDVARGFEISILRSFCVSRTPASVRELWVERADVTDQESLSLQVSDIVQTLWHLPQLYKLTVDDWGQDLLQCIQHQSAQSSISICPVVEVLSIRNMKIKASRLERFLDSFVKLRTLEDFAGSFLQTASSELPISTLEKMRRAGFDSSVTIVSRDGKRKVEYDSEIEEWKRIDA
ncbi:unnamed protein product [Somion occarium]|uniref:F-box domain-containing protein n=1 Tax=Somion occarium TaxID=3059160 RepID=A0ABP1D971_9APHY